MTTPKPNAELAYLVLDHIDAHPEQWNQGRWIGKAECSTVGCFAGWAVILSGAEPALDGGYRGPDGYVFTPEAIFGGESWPVSVLAEKLLRAGRFVDLSPEEDERDLFHEFNTREDLGNLVAEIFGPRPDGAV
jgi:hypothetical protein